MAFPGTTLGNVFICLKEIFEGGKNTCNSISQNKHESKLDTYDKTTK